MEAQKLDIEVLAPGFKGHIDIFDSLWTFSMGTETKGLCNVTLSDGKCAALYEALQLALLSHASCLLDIGGFYCAIIKHNENFSVVHLQPGDSSAVHMSCGRYVAVLHTTFDDLMLYITALSHTSQAPDFSVITVNAKAGLHGVASHSHKADNVALRVHTTSSEVTFSSTSPNDSRPLSTAKGVVLTKCFVPLNKWCPNGNDGKHLLPSHTVPEVLSPSHCTAPPEHVRYVQGHFHQAHPKYRANAGRQCVAMSLAAMACHKGKSVMTWNRLQLDEVLNAGNKLYSFLARSHCISDLSGQKHLLIADLPPTVTLPPYTYTLDCSSPVSGDLFKDTGELYRLGLAFPLKASLNKIFATYNQCFLTVATTTCAIFHQDGQYVVVDSHARDVKGKPSSTGKSILLCYRTVDDICVHIRLCSGYTQSTFGANFEITGVTLNSTVMISSRRTSSDVSATPPTSEPPDIDAATLADAVHTQQHLLRQCTDILAKPDCEVNLDILAPSPVQLVGATHSMDDEDVTIIGVTTMPAYQFYVLSKDVAHTLSNQLQDLQIPLIDWESSGLVSIVPNPGIQVPEIESPLTPVEFDGLKDAVDPLESTSLGIDTYLAAMQYMQKHWLYVK
ncbi:hypothetical protein KUCAC02_013341 [Chaenocephalus aceratus]|nr:hypothetical protein KUCAC02_013341 [Chaenocephalus aceratus]